ncbi:hypothetical protein [Verrucomicrobium spinosum]|uniref:hypothetical protein n=1 Tax=Verrucomicrobium spinosum TaxID=2736 RepID=UPI000B2ECC0F
MLAEAGLVALIGSALGLLGGMAYTKLALAGLNGAWSGATVGSTSPMTLTPPRWPLRGYRALGRHWHALVGQPPPL